MSVLTVSTYWAMSEVARGIEDPFMVRSRIGFTVDQGVWLNELPVLAPAQKWAVNEVRAMESLLMVCCMLSPVPPPHPLSLHTRTHKHSSWTRTPH